MRRRAAAALGLLGVSAAAAEPSPPAAAEIKVTAGSYYVGRVMGAHLYRSLANATTAGFVVMRGEVTQGALSEAVAWGTLHGYAFENACRTCVPSPDDKPAMGVSFRDAALVANVLSERAGLDAVYRDRAGQPVREAAGIDQAVVEPTLSGWRLPAIPEWQIAMRGADKAIVDGTYGGPIRAPNALGLIDTAGPLSEWTASFMDLDNGKRHYFICNETVAGVIGLSQCGLHAPGYAEPSVGFRLVRKGTR